MKRVYLDNAATTEIRTEVIEEITNVMKMNFGNPSSTHSFGRTAKSILELSRKTISNCLNCASQEIIFVSTGTEGNNWILRSAVLDLNIKRIITSKIEHHAVLHTVVELQKEYGIEVDYVRIKPNGLLDLDSLESLLIKNSDKTLVSLMHINNETGAILDLNKVGEMAHKYQALFHSDTVQSIGKTPIDLQNIPVDFIVSSSHKYHGPKGIGFVFIRKNLSLQPFIYGGEQEKGMRAGTEAVHQIAGMAKALELSCKYLEEEKEKIILLKKYLIEQLTKEIPEFRINGEDNDNFAYNILNIRLPIAENKKEMLLFNLDMKGIAVSRGSACQSGSVAVSHVLKEILTMEELKQPCLRLSFSHYNSTEDIDLFIDILKEI